MCLYYETGRLGAKKILLYLPGTIISKESWKKVELQYLVFLSLSFSLVGITTSEMNVTFLPRRRKKDLLLSAIGFFEKNHWPIDWLVWKGNMCVCVCVYTFFLSHRIDSEKEIATHSSILA